MPYTNGVGKYPHTPKTAIYVNHRGKQICVGQVNGHTFTKHIQGSKHMLRTPRAIALDAQNIVDAERAGATDVRIIDSETNRIYTATFATFKAKCFRVARGDGHQLGLTLDQWSINGQQPEAERRAEAEAIKAATADTVQMSLFGGA